MALTPKEIIEFVVSPENMKRVSADHTRFTMYNGQIRETIKEAIKKEFKKPETVDELVSRIIPLNITQKIINKLAAVYNQPVDRSPNDKNPSDEELINLYEPAFKINQRMKFANRYFKNCKHTFLEPFLDHKGQPKMRALSSHMYTPMSDDPVEPERMTAWVKHIRLNQFSVKDSRFHIWTDERFWITDGDGTVLSAEMAAMNNPQGINPYSVIPGTYISESDDGQLIPIPDDDLVNMSIVIPLLLTDLAFASKYLLWSILAVIGADAGNISFNPNTIIGLPPGADLKVIKPDLDPEKALSMIREITGMLLTTKNLKVGDVAPLTTKNLQSGVANMLDSAETTEDRKDQQEFFLCGEKEYWGKYAHNILPVWIKQGRVAPKWVGSFTDDFELSIRYPDPKPYIGDQALVDLEIKKLDNGLTTKERSLKVVNPDLDDNQIDMLEDEIASDKKKAVQSAMSSMIDQRDPQANPFDEEVDGDGDV